MGEWLPRFPDTPVERLVVNELDMPYSMEAVMRHSRVVVAGIGRSGSFAELLYESWRPAARQRSGCPVLLVPPGWWEGPNAGGARRLRAMTTELSSHGGDARPLGSVATGTSSTPLGGRTASPADRSGQQLLHHAGCPVVIVPPATAPAV
ncbi:hypothetical protein [Actinoplanes solisilvae]|uniref:hypothetical protein n=1 Tax=Actinoplanes solisilvae TaxID=2486853 RepID=UPI000FD75F67|nr:hypothetical protein [Actinoplanes solisilvae]